MYHRLQEGEFLSRPNRFIALCRVRGQSTVCHVKNTGRCRELLLPGCRVWLEESDNPARKTHFDLVAVESRGYTVNMDSQAPNAIFAEWARQGGYLPGLTDLKAETTYGTSRFDFSFHLGDRPGFVEIKGVTLLDENDMGYFPDAPTERGVRHLHELMAARKAGYEAGVCFVAQRDRVVGLTPNAAADPAFARALREAQAAGVRITCVVCHVTPETCTITHTIPIHL